jgi:excisionase family DNA binding protein
LIWLSLARAGTVISLGTAVVHFLDKRTREINSTRIYSSEEAARFLGVSRRTMVKLLNNNDIQAKMVQGNFRILGQNIIEYLRK